MKFIVVEGLDGSGKTTQVARLKERFIQQNIPCFFTCQPSNGELGKMARAVTQGKFKIENEALSLLFAAEHYQHFKEAIEPALENGKHVICDRYYYSNVAYQGVDKATIERIVSYIKAVRDARPPDIVVYLDVEPEECIKRISANRKEVSIYESLPLLKQQRERYFTIFDRLKATDNVVILDINNANEKTVSNKIWETLERIL